MKSASNIAKKHKRKLNGNLGDRPKLTLYGNSSPQKSPPKSPQNEYCRSRKNRKKSPSDKEQKDKKSPLKLPIISDKKRRRTAPALASPNYSNKDDIKLIKPSAPIDHDHQHEPIFK